MLTYHNDEALKAKAVKAAEEHRAQDMLLSGTYGRMNGHFRGCSVGCDAFDIKGEIVESPHALTAEYFGFPEWLERLRDSIFEGLPDESRSDFHVQLKQAIPVGVDLEPVRHKLAIRRMDRLIELQSKAIDSSEGDVLAAIQTTIAALKQVRRCHEAEIGSDVCQVDWSAAESAARSAAVWSAESAVSAAESAVWSAESAVWSARSAVWSARSAVWSARSAVWSAESAVSAAWQQEASDLIDLVKRA